MRPTTLLSRMLCALLGAATPAAAATLTRGPYLQLLTTHSVTIVWNTDAPAACALTIHPLADGATTLIAGGTDTVCAIPVDGLLPGAQYGYTPSADGTALAAESVFRTDDPSTTSFAFIAVGDSGSATSSQFAVRDRMVATPVDFLLHTGDMIYDTGAAVDFDPKFFAPYRDLIRSLMFWPCLGNHDWETAIGQPWRDAFYTPANNPAGSENYYSFDYCNAHFVVLNSNESTDPASPQYTFLDQDLAASDAFWKFVAFHHTIYSNSRHGSNLLLQANVVSLFDRYSVDLVLMGHDHDYERTFPLLANQVVAPGQGTVYITTGGGGQQLYPAGTSYFTAYSESAHNFARVAVDGHTLVAQMVRVDGTVPDSVTLMKDAPSPKCRGDAYCDDTRPCTVDTCQADGCHHEVVTPDAVKAAINAARLVDGCTGQTLPAFVSRALTQAARIVDRAARTGNPNRTGQQMTIAAHRLDVLARRAERAANRGRLVPACAAGFAAAVGTSESRAQCLASQRLPVADTYIEELRKGRKNHGGAPTLKVDSAPRSVAYLKFDLSAIPRVRKAVLVLHVVGKSPDGGKVYRIPATGWVEGTGNPDVDPNSGKGPGLTFAEVDTNGDGVLDAADDPSLAPQPDEVVAKMRAVADGEVVHLNLTRAFQSGPGIYSFAIMNQNPDGARFASKENPTPRLRPGLRIVR